MATKPTTPSGAAGAGADGALARSATVTPLFGRSARLEEEDELEVGLPEPAAEATAAAVRPAPELIGPPVSFLIGLNYAGKTTFARWAAGRMYEQGRETLLAAADPANRTLADFFDGVQQPSGNDAAMTAGWLRSLLDAMMRGRRSAMIDLGGGDTSMGKVLKEVPTLAQTMEEAGVSPVAYYFLGPRVDDLGSLHTFERGGFQPKATAIVLNRGRVDAGMDATEAFLPIRRHTAFRAAVDRGAIVIEMPRLDPPDLALEIERKRLHFAQARDGQVPEGRKMTPIGGLDRAAVSAWMGRMEAAFAPVRSWLP